MPLSRIPRLLLLSLPICALLACAGARVAERDPQIEELRGQLAVQADQLKQQEQRIEALEMRLAAVAARPEAAAPAAAPTAAPAPGDPAAPKIDDGDAPPKELQTVKLHPQKSGRAVRRPPRQNPVERAPRLPSTVELKEPDDERLAELEQPAPSLVDPEIRDRAAAEQSFAQAVQQLNAGDYLSAQTAFLAFAARYPRDPSADNAVYFAGLARAASGDCRGALAQFDRTLHDYPAGDARVPARLEKGRCLLLLGKRAEGRAVLEQLLDEDPGVLEAEQARALLRSDAAEAEPKPDK